MGPPMEGGELLMERLSLPSEFFCDGTKNNVALKLSKIFRENMSPAVIFFMVSEQKWLQGVIMAIWSKILRKPSRSFSNTHPRGTC